MGTQWRSQPMQLVQLFVQIEAAHDTVDELGQLGRIQFRDMNPNVNAFQRNFVNEVKRCDEMDRKLRFLEENIAKEKGLRALMRDVTVEDLSSNAGGITLDELEGRLDDLEKEILQVNSNQQMLDRNFNELSELRHVLSADSDIFAQNGGQQRGDFDAKSPLLAEGVEGGFGGKAVKLGFITGVILRSKFAAFERVLWRSTRGNLFMRQKNIDEPIRDPQTGEQLEKDVFIIFFQGERLQAKIKKICESFGATVYPCPEDHNERAKLSQQVNGRITDLTAVLLRSREHKRQALQGILVHLHLWKAKVMKEKAIYHTMNMFEYNIGRKCLIAEGWCPQTSTEEIQLALRRATQRSGALVPSILNVVRTDETPPTYFETDKYTNAFQEIVNAYGMAAYGEINPAVLTTVTFPFLFGIMFGDVGHGIILMLFSYMMIRNEKKYMGKKLNEIVAMPFGGRYMLFLMSIWAIYCGFIYNEFFSIPMHIFKSGWSYPTDPVSGQALTTGTYVPNGNVYAFGVDYVWKGAPNELDYYNSFKMKLSILLGVMQMSVGIWFSFGNYTKEKSPHKWIDILTVFVPQIIFMWAIFGYMCVLIIIKWSTDWYGTGKGAPDLILSTVINMFLQAGTITEPAYYSGQAGVQSFLVIIALIQVPIMLLSKPFLLKRYYANKATNHAHLDESGHGDDEPPKSSKAEGGGGHGHGEHGEFEFAEVFIHQAIHTIEFVLGAISNTASYLRLWALSLAHSELSTVFWDRLVVATIVAENGNAAFVFCGFAAWAGASLAVLIIMESLSAFLHALRLHWVEFNNKFFLGTGYRFLPFSYAMVLNADQEE